MNQSQKGLKCIKQVVSYV